MNLLYHMKLKYENKNFLHGMFTVVTTNSYDSGSYNSKLYWKFVPPFELTSEPGLHYNWCLLFHLCVAEKIVYCILGYSFNIAHSIDQVLYTTTGVSIIIDGNSLSYLAPHWWATMLNIYARRRKQWPFPVCTLTSDALLVTIQWEDVKPSRLLATI